MKLYGDECVRVLADAGSTLAVRGEWQIVGKRLGFPKMARVVNEIVTEFSGFGCQHFVGSSARLGKALMVEMMEIASFYRRWTE